MQSKKYQFFDEITQLLHVSFFESQQKDIGIPLYQANQYNLHNCTSPDSNHDNQNIPDINFREE